MNIKETLNKRLKEIIEDKNTSKDMVFDIYLEQMRFLSLLEQHKNNIEMKNLDVTKEINLKLLEIEQPKQKKSSVLQTLMQEIENDEMNQNPTLEEIEQQLENQNHEKEL